MYLRSVLGLKRKISLPAMEAKGLSDGMSQSFWILVYSPSHNVFALCNDHIRATVGTSSSPLSFRSITVDHGKLFDSTRP